MLRNLVSDHRLSSLGSPEDLKNPNYLPPLARAVPLGIQHVLAMFVANITPAFIIAQVAGFSGAELVQLLQMSMLFAGIATLLQTIGIGPVGARLPIVQGTTFIFLPIILPIVSGQGTAAMAVITGGIIVGGVFHAIIGNFIGRLRPLFPPLVTGLVVLMIGLSLVRVGIQYAAGGAAIAGTDDYGAVIGWAIALAVIAVTLTLSFFGRGMWSVASVLIGLLVGYALALALGLVDFTAIEEADWIVVPSPVPYGVEFTTVAVVGFCLMAFVSAIETVGDVSAITKSGANREVTAPEVRGAVLADGIGTAVAGVFGALPNTSYSQNVGLVALTRVMSRHVATIGACVLILCGLIPKIGALISTIPLQVLGGSVIIMFGMVAAAGISMLAEVNWNRRNMAILATALSVGLGLQLEPSALQHLPELPKLLLTSGILPAAFIAIGLNLVIPQELDRE